MTITAPTLEPQAYRAKPTPQLVVMHFDGTPTSLNAVRAWLESTFPGENIAPEGEVEDDRFTIRSTRLFNALYHLQTGVKPAELVVESGDWIWVDEEMFINAGTQIPVRSIGYVPVT